MSNKHDSVVAALQWRYATKTYDASKKLSDEEADTVLEAGRLAPSSFGLEPWVFVVVSDPALRAKVREAAFGQTPVTDASHMVVVTRRTDMREHGTDELVERTARIRNIAPESLKTLREMVSGFIQGLDDQQLDAWVRAQVYIPLGIMLTTAALMGIDATPMEGFNPAGVDEVLGLKKRHLASTALMALGHRDENDPHTKLAKVRREKEEVVVQL